MAIWNIFHKHKELELEKDQEERLEEVRPVGEQPAEFLEEPLAVHAEETAPAVTAVVAEPATADAIATLAESAPSVPEVKKSFFQRLKDQLAKTKQGFISKLKQTIRLHGKIDEDLLDELEEIMIQSDIGPETAMRLIDSLRNNREARADGSGNRLIQLLKDGMLDALGREEKPLLFEGVRPFVVLVVGVNGTGKTTTIGKLAQRLRGQGRNVTLVAADTFRAAAIEQLEIWAHATGAKIVCPQPGADPGAVCFDGLKTANAEQADVVLIDTAGRLHTKSNLMEELKKIERVIKKVTPDAPHETLLVLDATTGQNAISQAKIFSEAVPVTGLVMTKLDGTAKGGILIALADKFKIPIRMIGIGESAEDYRDFSPTDFVDALFEEDAAGEG